MKSFTINKDENGYKVTITHSYLRQLELTEAWVTASESISMMLPTLTECIQQLGALNNHQINSFIIQSNLGETKNE